MTATDNLTLERIHCRCPVVGTWKNGFIVLHDGQPRAVGKSEAQHNLLPVAARLIQGEPLRVVAERVAMQGRTLRWLASRGGNPETSRQHHFRKSPTGRSRTGRWRRTLGDADQVSFSRIFRIASFSGPPTVLARNTMTAGMSLASPAKAGFFYCWPYPFLIRATFRRLGDGALV